MIGRPWFRRYVFAPNRRTALLALPVLLGIGAIFLVLQRQAPADWRQSVAGRGGLTVMSFNVLLGGRPIAEALDAIEAAAPDLVCLQEMTP